MASSERRFAVAAGVLAAAALLTVFIIVRDRVSAPSRQTDAPLPAALGGWTKAADVDFESRVFEMLGTGAVRGALYRDAGGAEVQVIVVRAARNRSAFHPPEYCMTGGGRELVEQRVAAVDRPGLPPFPCLVNEMVFKDKTGARLLVWNWYKARGAMMPNFYKQQIALFIDVLTGGAGEGAMVNMYTPVRGDAPRAAADRMAEVAYALLPNIQ